MGHAVGVRFQFSHEGHFDHGLVLFDGATWNLNDKPSPDVLSPSQQIGKIPDDQLVLGHGLAGRLEASAAGWEVDVNQIRVNVEPKVVVLVQKLVEGVNRGRIWSLVGDVASSLVEVVVGVVVFLAEKLIVLPDDGGTDEGDENLEGPPVHTVVVEVFVEFTGPVQRLESLLVAFVSHVLVRSVLFKTMRQKLDFFHGWGLDGGECCQI